MARSTRNSPRMKLQRRERRNGRLHRSSLKSARGAGCIRETRPDTLLPPGAGAPKET